MSGYSTAKIDTSDSEEEILRRSRTEPEAFRVLYEKYFRNIMQFVLHRVGEKEIAADITQQVFLKALLNLGKFQFRGLPFSAWLFRIAVNECNDFFRKTKRVRHVVLDEVGLEQLFDQITAEDTLDELQQRLPAILGALKEQELLLIEMRFFEARPFKEIATLMNITETYAKVKTYRTLDKMKRLFHRKK